MQQQLDVSRRSSESEECHAIDVASRIAAVEFSKEAEALDAACNILRNGSESASVAESELEVMELQGDFQALSVNIGSGQIHSEPPLRQSDSDSEPESGQNPMIQNLALDQILIQKNLQESMNRTRLANRQSTQLNYLSRPSTRRLIS